MPFESGPTFRVLGHLDIGNGAPVLLGGRKQRALLAYLLLHAGEPVAIDRLIDALWGERPPATAAAVVYAFIRKTRLALDGTPATITTEPHGYRLVVDDGEIDARRFEFLAAEGREALAHGDPGSAARLLADALDLWRGPAFADLEDDPSSDAARRRLDEARRDAALDRIDAELSLGRHERLVPELTQLVAENQYAERPCSQLVLALYRSGRQAEALEVYRASVRRLREELGLEPSPALRRLEQAILRHDPELDPPRQSVAPPEGALRRRLVRAVVVALVVLAAASAALAFFLVRGSQVKRVTIRANSVAVVDPSSGRVLADVAVGSQPDRVVAGTRALWTMNAADSTVSRIDPHALRSHAFGVAATPSGIGVADGSVWVADGKAGSVSIIDPASGVTTRTISLGFDGIFDSRRSPRETGAVAVRGESVFVAAGFRPTGVTAIDGTGTNARRLAAYVPAPSGPNALAASRDALWSLAHGVLTRVDLGRHTSGVVQIGSTLPDVFGGHTAPEGVAAGEGGVWATNPYDGLVVEVSPETGAVLASVRVPGRPTSIATGGGAVWTAGLDGEVSRIDPGTATLIRTVRLGRTATDVAVAFGRVWVAVGA